MIKLKHYIAAFFALMLLLPLAVLAAPVGKITNLTGNADITVAGKAARIAAQGDFVNIGDFIRTKSKSKAEITFNEGNILRLAENTRVRITEYMSGEKRNSSLFNLFRGRIQNIVKTVGSAGGRYEVHTPTAVCGVRGTHFFNFYLAGASGSIFQEGTGYGYSKNNPADVKTITAGQGMFVPSATLGAQLRSVSNQQLDEMKNATEISGTSGTTGGAGDSGSSSGSGSTGGVDNSTPPPTSSPTPPSAPSPTPPITIPPPVQPLQTTSTSTLSLNISPAESFAHTIDNGTITGTTSDNGTTYTLTGSGAMTGTADHPGAGLVNGAITDGSTTVYGLSGYMMGLPNEAGTGAKALLSTVYVNNSGQAGFLLGPLTASFTSTSFSGTGLAYQYAPVATTGFTPQTLSLTTLSDIALPVFGNISIYYDGAYFNCSSATCQSQAKGIDLSGGKIGVWGGYSYGGFYYNSGEITSLTKRYMEYDADKKAFLYSENISGIIDTAAKEVSISGDFSYLSTLYKGTLSMNHFGYYADSIYTSISSGVFQLQPMNFASEFSSFEGIIGSTGNIWSNASATFTALGKYTYYPVNYNILPEIWQSYNYRAGSGYLTNDEGGAYKGYLNTQLLLSSTNTVNTDALALYVDAAGNIGILRGNLNGSVYPDEYGFKADGTLNRIELATGTGIPASTFVSSGTTSGLFTLEPGVYNNLLSGGPSLILTGMTSTFLDFTDSSYKSWGIAKTDLSGTYISETDPTGDAVFNYNRNYAAGTESVVYTQKAAAWSASDGGYFSGNIAGAATDWQSASTAVFGGTVKGVFDASTASTGWHASALATRIETAAFIDLASTSAGRSKLADLNIPSVLVGTVNLSGSDANWSSLSINDIGFYAYTTGAKPLIWASNNVSGTAASASVATGTTTHLTGLGGFAADFTVRKWDSSNNKWAASIAGTGGFNGTNTFQGGAAGTISGSSITGTASGTAHTGALP